MHPRETDVFEHSISLVYNNNAQKKNRRLKSMKEKTITADMAIGDVVSQYPNTINVFFKHGLGCVGCAVARFENIQQGAAAHGIDVDALISDLNQAVSQPQSA
jgi:hybrid cluster-associated redox disulfide protein